MYPRNEPLAETSAEIRIPANMGRLGRHCPSASAHLPALLALVLAFTLLGAPAAFAITRASVLSRAQAWVDHPVPYSQSKTHLGYRTDCSGYVSMCWATGISWSTASFHSVTHTIAKTDLKPGDALLKKGYHVRLFHNWTDSSHTSYVAYEANTKVAIARVHSLATDLHDGYVPTRYNGIVDGPAASNVIWNGSFDAWVRSSWGADSDAPVLWQVSGADGQTLAVHRTDIYHTGGSSLQLLNTSDSADSYTELTQTAPVTPGVRYQLVAWARTASDPSVLTLSVSYLDASGQSIAESSTTGAAFGVDNTAFKPMSAPTTAPAGAVNACVTASLAGGTTDGIAGSSAFLDDISLTRPVAAASIKTSGYTMRYGSTVKLTGSVTPSSAVGVAATMYVQRPGGGWQRVTSSAVTASGSSAVWRATYHFKRGMRKGIYHFRTVVPSFRGVLGVTSSTASVRLK